MPAASARQNVWAAIPGYRCELCFAARHRQDITPAGCQASDAASASWERADEITCVLFARYRTADGRSVVMRLRGSDRRNQTRSEAHKRRNPKRRLSLGKGPGRKRPARKPSPNWAAKRFGQNREAKRPGPNWATKCCGPESKLRQCFPIAAYSAGGQTQPAAARGRR